MLEASIVVIGDEILGGFVQDTNSGWLAERLRLHGVALSWLHTVPDSFAAIDEALSTELARSRPRLVITTGGIGSTPDDVTYEAIAASLDRELVVSPVISERIHAALDWTREQGVEVDGEFTRHMMRMARIPQGATLLREHRGWAPGVRIDVDGGVDEDAGATIVVLPGVPSQLRSIVRDAVEPDLLVGRNEARAVAEITHSFPESALNLCFAKVLDRWPDVKLGSYPGLPMLVRLMGPADEVERARQYVATYVDDLEADPAGARLARAWSERFGESEDARAADEAAARQDAEEEGA